MSRIAWAILSLCVTLSTAARADEWSKTFSLTSRPELRVETSDANIRVDTWDKNTIEARVTTERWKIGDGGIKIYDRQTGDSVELEVRFPHRNFVFEVGRRSVEIEVHMPREGKLNLRTSDGHIRLSNFKGEMELETGDGRQDIAGVDGALRARASDGHIEVSGRFDGLDLSTSDGHIKAEAATGSTVAKGWNLRTGDGSVTLQVPQNLVADVDLHTNDGHITLDLPVSVEGKLSRRDIRGKINGGGNLVIVHTGDGSIRLEKS